MTTVGGGSEVFRTPSETLPGLGWLAVTLPEQVAYQHEVRVWTDADLVFWGGQTLSIDEVPTGDPGVAYSPDSDTWRELPPSPKPAAVRSAAVWTGSEVIICCGHYPSQGMRVTASYDPITNTWQRREDSPLFGDFASAVWTGSEMLVVVRDGVMGYDPVSDTWRHFPDPPALLGRLNATAWTGNEIVIWPRDVQRGVRRGLAMDPEIGSWRLLPDPPAWPAVPDIAVTNDSLIIWGGIPGEYEFDSERAVGSRLDLTSNEWVRLPDALPEPEGCECNLGSQTLLWTGRHLLVSTGFFASGVSDEPLLLAYHPTEDRWSQVSAVGPVHGFDLSSGLMTGDRVVFRGDRLYLSPPGWVPEPR